MSGEPFDEFALTGRAHSHVRQYSQPRFASRPEVAAAFLALRAAAAHDGIDLLPIASWRPFEAQARNCASDLLGRDLVLDMLPAIFRDHVLDVDGP
jgi:hypothetical protein